MAMANATNETFPYTLRHVNFVQDVQMVTCGWVQTLDPSQRCGYVLSTPQCSEDVFIVNYVELFYCTLDTSHTVVFILGTLGLFACCGLLFISLGLTADGFFCPSLKVLSAMLGLNENVAGVTLLAFGNCAPDMITSITGLSGESRRLYSDTLGASLFVVFFVAGSIVAFVPFTTQPTNFLRDSLFLFLAVVYIDYALKTDTSVTVNEGIVILSIYLMYIVVVCLDQCLAMKQLEEEEGEDAVPSFPSEVFSRMSSEAQIEMNSRSASNLSDGPYIPYSPSHGPNYSLFQQFFNTINPINVRDWATGNNFTRAFQIIKSPIVVILKILIPVVDFELDDHGWSKLLNCIQFIMLPFFVVWSIGMEHEDTHIPLEYLTLTVTIPLTLLMFIFSRTDKIPFYHKYFAILAAVGSVYIIFGCAAETISILSVLGLTTQRSNSFLGCTLLAWGNSIGDLVANVALARQGYQKMGFAACFGGPLFNTLVGIGIGFTYKAATSEGMKTNKKTLAEGTMGVNNTVFVELGLSMLILGASMTDYALRRSIGLYMLGLYTVFFIYQFLGELEIVHTYGSDHRLDVKLEESDILDFRPRNN